ncbi:hypothetical protein Tco_0609078, partial [Tanacetum coccineum]
MDNLIIKYKIRRELYPRLPSEEFVMSELLDDAIGIYHRMFDFSGIRIPFSSFFLALIKHYRVHFSQLGPLGLNKVITFKRHPDVAIDYSRPVAGSFSMADVCWLSAYVIKLRDMPEGVLVLYGLSHVCYPVLWGADENVIGIHDFLCLLEWTGAEVQEEPHLDVKLTIQRLPFYCTLPVAVDAVISNPTLEDLSHVAKHTRSALAQSSSSTTRPSLFVGDSDDESDGDDDACEIPLVTPLRSTTVIPSLGNQGWSSTSPAAEGPNTRG